MSDGDFEVYAIKYAERVGTRAMMFAGGDPHDGPMAMDYCIWALRNRHHTIVVDTGFGREEGERRGRTFLRTPSEALALVGIDPVAVSDVIITHLHYDHAGNLDAFPEARFHLQAAEMAFATGRSMTHAAIRHSFRLDDVLGMVQRVYGERVAFHDGDVQGRQAGLGDGVELFHVPGHTPGQMSVRVATARGKVLVASDAAHYYENFLTGRAFTTHDSMSEILDGQQRIRRLVASDDHVIPGHDPLVLARFPPPREELRGSVACLHQEPVTPIASTDNSISTTEGASR